MFKFFKKSFQGFAEEVKRTVNNLGPIKKRRHRRQMKMLGFGLIYVVLIYIIIVLLAILFYVGSLSIALNYSLKGKANLEAALTAAKSENYTTAKKAAENAQANLAIAQGAASKLHDSAVLNRLPVVSGEVDELYNLLTGVELLSRALGQGLIFVSELKQDLDPGHHLSYSKFSTVEKGRIIDRVYRSGPELNGLKANIELASVYFKRLQFHGILLPFKYKLMEVSNYIDTGAKTLEIAVPLSEVLPLIAGHPNKSTILVLMQNQDELRPTGGFLGTYGILETSKGDINRFETHDVYHLDMPVQDKINIEPPQPLRDYLNKKWYFRDSNWSPDWPTASRQIQSFYHLEDNLLKGKDQINNFKGQFTGVMAISPNMVMRLLGVVGPIKIGLDTYDARNFSKLLEYQVEQGYMADGVPSWQRKEVIGEIIKELKIKIFDLPLSRLPELVSVIDQGLTERDVLFYFNNPVAQKTMADKGWGGEIKQTAGDYIYYVDANLASLKTDSVMTRDYNYQVDQDSGYAKFTVAYHHGSATTNWRISAYKTYARLYVPVGSELIKVEGARTKPVISVENNRTNFGVLINVAPGETKNVSFYYKLPKSVLLPNYGLYIQKQPNSVVNKLVIDAKSKLKVKSFSPPNIGQQLDDNQVFWQTTLTRDAYFQVNK